MKKPVISVVIPAYNEEKYLGKTLETLKNQDFQKPYEVIVVDNGSTDKTVQIAKKFKARIIHEPKKGVACARQAGFMAARAKIIATTDADTLLPKNWLTKIEGNFLSHPKAVALAGHLDLYDTNLFLRLACFPLSLVFFSLIDAYSGTNIAVRKDAFNKIGGFNLNYGAGEDTDICRRLKKIGPVLRNPFLVVATSARRYRARGFIGGTWTYLFCFLYSKIRPEKSRLSFKASSELTFDNHFSKNFDYLASVILIAAGIIILLLKASPAFAQTLKKGKDYYSQKVYQLMPKNNAGDSGNLKN